MDDNILQIRYLIKINFCVKYLLNLFINIKIFIMKSHLKNQKLDRNQLKLILGGRIPCPTNYDCGQDNCCINGACHPITDAGPKYGLCTAVIDY